MALIQKVHGKPLLINEVKKQCDSIMGTQQWGHKGLEKALIEVQRFLLTSLSDSTRTWSYSLKATKNMMDVTFSKQCIHFRRSDLCPPTSTILKIVKQVTY